MTPLAARLAGPERLLLSEPSAAKRAVASAWGAVPIDPRAQDVIREIQDATEGLGADVVFVAVSVPEVLRQGLEACRRIGTLVIVASLMTRPGRARQIQVRERTIVGTSMYTGDDYRLAIRLWQAGGWISARF